MRGPVTDKEKVDSAAWAQAGAIGHTICLLQTEFFSHLHGLPANNSSYSVDTDELLECSGAEKFRFTASGLTLVFGSLLDESFVPFETEYPAVLAAETIVLGDSGNAVRYSAASPVWRTYLEGPPSRFYGDDDLAGERNRNGEERDVITSDDGRHSQTEV